MRRFASGAAVLLAVSLTAGACAKKKPDAPPPAPAAAPPVETKPASPPPPPPPPAAAPAPAPTEDEIFAKKSLDELSKELAPVYFGYDAIDLSEEARGSLQKNLQWLNRWKSTKIMVEGHADSRGSN